MTKLSLVRVGRKRCLMMLAIVAASTSLVLLHAPYVDARIGIELQRAAIVVNDPANIPIRCVIQGTTLERTIASLLGSRRDRLAAANALFEAAGDRQSDTAARATGIACLLAKRSSAALQAFEEIPPLRRRWDDWANIAGAAALAADRHERDALLAGLSASDHAAAMASPTPEVTFNRAFAVELLGLESQAADLWRLYLRMDTRSAWADIARRHVSVFGKSDIDAWKDATVALPSLPEGELARLTLLYPQLARTFGESVYLAAWADAVSAGKTADAAAALVPLRTIGTTLHRSTGESLLSDIVAEIDRAPSRGVARRLGILASAVQEYRRGRLATQGYATAVSIPVLLHARDEFQRAESSMAAVAECYVAVTLIDANRSAEARPRLVALVASEKASGAHHPALIAFALYHIALCDAAQGSWSDALASADEALEIFDRLGERDLAGTVQSLLAQIYEWLGQPMVAWSHGIAAMTTLSRTGNNFRLRVTIAGLSRTELRHGRFENSRSLIRLEETLAARVNKPLQDGDMFLRLAVAEDRTANPAGAARAVRSAERVAHRLPQEVQRKLLADIEGVTATIVRRSDPRRAFSLLSSSIAFQHSAGRALLLPQLYLERGRTAVDLNRKDQAAQDFEEGIRVLERQRTRTEDAILRAGIFDDADELFGEAISLCLQNRNAERAFAYVERGRARALLEQLGSRNADAAYLSYPSAGSASVRQSLPPHSLILEYALLPDRAVIFALDARGMDVISVPVDRARVLERADAFIAALSKRAPMDRVRESGADLHDIFIASLGQRLYGVHTLVIVPDVAMQAVPFTALTSRHSRRFLVEDLTVIGAPSAAVFIAASNHLARLGNKPVETAAIFANPFLKGPFATLPPLPSSEREARKIARQYRETFLATGPDATIERFVGPALAYDVVHFAGHGVIRPAEPWQSALLFAGERGVLTVDEIARHRIDFPRIVVLAACSTLRGTKAASTGFLVWPAGSLLPAFRR